MKRILFALLILTSCKEDEIMPPTMMCASWSTDEFRQPEEFACVSPEDIEIIRDTSDFITQFRTWECDDCQ